MPERKSTMRHTQKINHGERESQQRRTPQEGKKEAEIFEKPPHWSGCLWKNRSLNTT